MLIRAVRVSDPPLHRRPLRDALDPFPQVGERLHLVLGEAAEAPSFHPRPGADVRDRVLALAVAGEVLARRAGELARQVDFEDAVDPQGFVFKALDRV